MYCFHYSIVAFLRKANRMLLTGISASGLPFVWYTSYNYYRKHSVRYPGQSSRLVGLYHSGEEGLA